MDSFHGAHFPMECRGNSWAPVNACGRSRAREGTGVCKLIAIIPHSDRTRSFMPTLIGDRTVGKPAGQVVRPTIAGGRRRLVRSPRSEDEYRWTLDGNRPGVRPC